MMQETHVDKQIPGVKVFEQAPYKLPSDPTSRTGALFGKFLMGALGVLALMMVGLYAENMGLVGAAAYVLLLILAFGGPYYYPLVRRALRYEIRDDSVTIIRAWPFRQIVIPIRKIIGVSRPSLERSDIELSREGWGRPRLSNPIVRLPSGTGSVVISRGLHNYHVGAHGIRLYASVTSAQRMVAIECEDRSYLVSPENPDEFVRDIRVMT